MYVALQGDDARSRLLRGARAVGLPGASGHDEAAASRWADGCIRRPNARIAGVTDIATPIVDKTGAAIAILACPYLTHPDDAGAMPVEQVGVALYETARRIAATVDQRFMQSAVETPRGARPAHDAGVIRSVPAVERDRRLPVVADTIVGKRPLATTARINQSSTISTRVRRR
jgi:hypothetical protein